MQRVARVRQGQLNYLLLLALPFISSLQVIVDTSNFPQFTLAGCKLQFVIHKRRWARCGYIGYCSFLYVFVRLRISPARIKLAASNERAGQGTLEMQFVHYAHAARFHKRRISSVPWPARSCVDIRPFPKTNVLFEHFRLLAWIS